MKTKYLLGISMLAIGSFAMTSCDDDDTYDVVGNPNNMVYINIPGQIPEGMPKNAVAYTILHTPVGPVVDSTPEELEINAMCTKPAPTDIQVTFEVDPTMSVDGYATIPENSGIKVTLESNTLTIPAGSNRSSATVKAIIDDTNANWALLTEPAYLIPIKIVSSSAGVPSTSLVGAAYVGVRTIVKEGMVNPALNSAIGSTITDKTGWSGTYKVTATGVEEACPVALFDGNSSRAAYRVNNHAPNTRDEVVTTIDLGKVYTLSSVRFDYYGGYWGINAGKLETSMDGSEWTDQGSRTWSTNPRQAAFAFWAPFQMRYVRLTSTSFYDGTGEGQYMAEFHAFEQSGI